MGNKTGIEWTDATWNPVRGCSRVSPGCKHCYAERVAARFCGPGQPYEGLAFRKVTVDGYGEDHMEPRWTGEVRLIPEHLADPLRWKRPRRIFVNSMSDLFHEKLSNEEIAAVFGVMAAAPQHTFQVLTKRPEGMREFFRWMEGWGYSDYRLDGYLADGGAWPLPNVWLGVSVENQHYADERIPILLDTPAAIRFVSAEPLLGPVDLLYSAWNGAESLREMAGIDWVIVGAESGPGARPMQEDWARSIRDQCAAAGVAFFLKQFAENGRKVHLPVLDGRQHVEWPR